MVHVTTPPPTTATHEEIIWLAGPRLIGLLFNWGLLGVLTTQVYIYHVNFPKDKPILKALVYGIYLLDWAQTCSATYDAFQWFVYGWGDISVLYLVYTDFLNVPLLSSIIGALVQIFYGWRIWIFSKSKVLFGVVCLLACLQLGGGIAVSYYLFMDASETSTNPHLNQTVAVRLAGSAVVDAVISVSMTYFLLRSKAQALGPMTNVMTRLVRLTIETGTITVMMAILDLVFFLKEHNELHQVSGVVLCKVYSNTLLVLFNNRLVERNNLNKEQHVGSNDSALSEFRVARPATLDQA
ncbi:hypothetical protein C8F04DRAFT_1118580 [Mycena alexandri]|uniref:DUF6534 domain-containing protein n=1 Tax=Mycena alexandri TaxID=1745969 RepID=A0AAD6SIQ2_9AGAR|nr:hypothetical protein C8F04DRAFT_1118580 [Mycena alexandri]